MNLNVLEQYVFDAERAFQKELYLEGKAYLEMALMEEPTFGKAHNHLGWIYLYHLNDFVMAETHLKLAMKYAKQYSAPYIHLLHLLFEAKRLDEFENLIEKATLIPGVQKSFLYNERGRLSEVKGNSTRAIKWYRMAIRWSFNENEIEICRENIRRARSKRWLLVGF